MVRAAELRPANFSIAERPAVCECQNVRRLHVAMDETGGVGGVESCRDRLRDPHGVHGFEARAAGEGLVEVLALDEAHLAEIHRIVKGGRRG
jgi:hypothetical protein